MLYLLAMLLAMFLAMFAAMLAAGCEQEPKAPPRPPVQLLPMLDTFKALAESGPKPPDAKRRTALRDLVQVAFSSSDRRLAMRARRSLLGEEDAFWVLEEALASDDPGLRMNAAYELANLKHRPSVPKLLLRLKDELDPQVVLYVADALARLGNHSGLSEITAQMQRRDLAERAGGTAIQILKNAGQALAESPTYEELKAGLRQLHGEWRRRGVPSAEDDKPDLDLDGLTKARLARHLVDLEAFQLREVDEARYVLGHMGRKAVPLLVQAVAASETYLRQHGMEILRGLGPVGRPAAKRVIALLGVPLSRAAAIQTLGAIRAEEAAGDLRPLLDDPDLEVRSAVAGALGQIGDRASIPRLKALLADSRETMDVRVQAAFSLALLDAESESGGLAFLQERKEKQDYHAPTIQELLDRIQELK